jgi:hypothetical protein
MQQIADSLKKLGMSEYADRFAEERIKIDVLSELTDQDLERFGFPVRAGWPSNPRRRSRHRPRENTGLEKTQPSPPTGDRGK